MLRATIAGAFCFADGHARLARSDGCSCELVRGLDPLLERTRAAGYRFLSVAGRPIQRPFGRFVFLRDADNILVEYAEPAAGR